MKTTVHQLRFGKPGFRVKPGMRYVEFSDYGWKRVEFGVEELKGKGIITYEVSRTWNPKRMGVSGDGRDLGVMVAVP